MASNDRVKTLLVQVMKLLSLLSPSALRWLFFFGCIGCIGLFSCAPEAPVSPSPCAACLDTGVCKAGFRCLHGVCVPHKGALCKLPQDAVIRSPDGGEQPAEGCQPSDVLSCIAASHPCLVGTSVCFRGLWTDCGDWQPSLGKVIGTPCESGKGACQVTGVWRCRAIDRHEPAQMVCDNTPVAPQEERCNGLDDNCDGQIDEALTVACYEGPNGSDGVGPCRGGQQHCREGKWGPCEGQLTPATEVCDGVDNDCDGQVDEGLTRACYDGPAGSAGRGPCRSGEQRCVAASWGPCEGQISPKQGQVCAPFLVHHIDTSLLNCQATAQSRVCYPEGHCDTEGSQQKYEDRKADANLSLRCRGNNSKLCGAFSSEAVVRREVTDRAPKDGGISLSIFGVAGSCACNDWCDKGCNGQSGCCQSCAITAQECNASAHYLAYHRLSWEASLPAPHSLVLDVQTLEGGTPLFALASGADLKHFSLKAGQRCSITLPGDSQSGLVILITNHSTLSCAGGEDSTIILRFRPATPEDNGLFPCFSQ